MSASTSWVEECELSLDLIRLVRDGDKEAEEKAAWALAQDILRGARSASAAGEGGEGDGEGEDKDVAGQFLAGLTMLLTQVSNLERACASVDRFSKTDQGRKLLSLSLSPEFVNLAFEKYPAEVKVLLGRQVKRMVGTKAGDKGNESDKKPAEKLEMLESMAPRILTEEEVAVGQIIGECFQSAAASFTPDQPEDLRALDDVIGILAALVVGKKWNGNSMRVIESLTKIASTSEQALLSFVKCGILSDIACAFSEEGGDQLIIISLLELLQTMLHVSPVPMTTHKAHQASKTAAHFLPVLQEPLMKLIQSRSKEVLTMSRCHSMKLLASLQSLNCEEDSTSQVDLDLTHAVLSTLNGEEEEDDPDLTRSTMDAISGYTSSRKGLESLLSQPSGKDLVSKLIAFALETRALRGEGVQEFALSSLGRVIEHSVGTCDALLKPLLFGALADMGLALAEAFNHVLTKPEDALRGACYDCLAEMAKTSWGCIEICAKKDFIERLANARSELVPAVSTKHEITNDLSSRLFFPFLSSLTFAYFCCGLLDQSLTDPHHPFTHPIVSVSSYLYSCCVSSRLPRGGTSAFVVC